MLLAFVAGLVTILNPCVLPILPILIGSAMDQNKYGPFALSGGLVASFSLFGIIVIAFGFSIGLNEQTVRMGAAALLIVAGVLLLVPRAQDFFASAVAPIVGGGNRLLRGVSGSGLTGQFAIGGLLGLVWAPCVGPTLGVAIAAASRGENLLGALFIFLLFGIGVATSLLVFAYGSRKTLIARKARFQSISHYGKPLFGGALILVGLFILTGVDKRIEALALHAMPQWLIDFTTRF